MRDERRTILDYTPQAFDRVRRTCLHVATVLGEWTDHVTLIGGAVPSLLVPQDQLPAGVEPHPGTVDVDLGLELAVLDDEGYASIAELLRAAGYRAELKEEDRIRRQTWRTDPRLGEKVTIDFLIPRSPQAPPDARIQNLERDFAAIIADGLHLVERDRRRFTLTGPTLRGEQAECDLWVCGPGAFTVLKARAIARREKPKDAYDLYYVLRGCPGGVGEVAGALRPLLDDRDAREAVALLERCFRTPDSVGPARAAYFLYGEAEGGVDEDVDALRASAQAYVQRLLAALRV